MSPDSSPRRKQWTNRVSAVMSWCPITSYDTSDWAYEWNEGDGEKTHCDSVPHELAKGTANDAELAEDLAKADAVGNDVEHRINMFSSLYYLMSANEGYGTSQVASSWRIRTGGPTDNFTAWVSSPWG